MKTLRRSAIASARLLAPLSLDHRPALTEARTTFVEAKAGKSRESSREWILRETTVKAFRPSKHHVHLLRPGWLRRPCSTLLLWRPSRRKTGWLMPRTSYSCGTAKSSRPFQVARRLAAEGFAAASTGCPARGRRRRPRRRPHGLGGGHDPAASCLTRWSLTHRCSSPIFFSVAAASK